MYRSNHTTGMVPYVCAGRTYVHTFTPAQRTRHSRMQWQREKKITRLYFDAERNHSAVGKSCVWKNSSLCSRLCANVRDCTEPVLGTRVTPCIPQYCVINRVSLTQGLSLISGAKSGASYPLQMSTSSTAAQSSSREGYKDPESSRRRPDGPYAATVCRAVKAPPSTKHYRERTATAASNHLGIPRTKSILTWLPP